MNRDRMEIWYLLFGTILGFAGIAAFASVANRVGDDFIIPAVIALGVVGVTIFKGPVGKAIGRRISEGTPTSASPELMMELDDMRSRMLELEERLDFAERMLAKPQGERIGGSAN